MCPRLLAFCLFSLPGASERDVMFNHFSEFTRREKISNSLLGIVNARLFSSNAISFRDSNLGFRLTFYLFGVTHMLGFFVTVQLLLV